MKSSIGYIWTELSKLSKMNNSWNEIQMCIISKILNFKTMNEAFK